jgi:hypothetical protein
VTTPKDTSVPDGEDSENEIRHPKLPRISNKRMVLSHVRGAHALSVSFSEHTHRRDENMAGVSFKNHYYGGVSYYLYVSSYRSSISLWGRRFLAFRTVRE